MAKLFTLNLNNTDVNSVCVCVCVNNVDVRNEEAEQANILSNNINIINTIVGNGSPLGRDVSKLHACLSLGLTPTTTIIHLTLTSGCHGT